jgi:hypothetical protein
MWHSITKAWLLYGDHLQGVDVGTHTTNIGADERFVLRSGHDADPAGITAL